MTKEPAAGIGVALTAILAALWAILSASGVELTEGLKDGIEALIYALIAIPAATGFLIRFFVTPTAKAEAQVEAVKEQAKEAVEIAYVAKPGIDPKPVITSPSAAAT